MSELQIFQGENNNLSHCCLDKGIQGTDVNPTYHFKNGGSSL